jgi:hypothetical protein
MEVALVINLINKPLLNFYVGDYSYALVRISSDPKSSNIGIGVLLSDFLAEYY